MRFLQSWVMTPLAEALGWTVLHSLWEGAILSLVLGMVLWATRSASARYLAGCVAMLVMFAGTSITLLRMMPERLYGPAEVATIAPPPWNAPADLGAGSSHSRVAEVVPWFAPFWIAGVWIFAFGQVAGWIGVYRLRRRGVCWAPEHWQKEIDRLSARLHVSARVQLLESCLAHVPMVLGHIRPVILMPIGLLAGLPPGQIESLLLHELAHIRRFDYLTNVLQRALECLLFYHPAVWWMSEVISVERENCCDDVVVATTSDVPQYAAALTALAQFRWSGGTPTIAATSGSLVKRVHRLLYPEGANGVRSPIFAAAIVITVTAATLASWPLRPPQKNLAAGQEQASRAESSSDGNWTKHEVVYIITDEERAAFAKLTTNEEREKFIEQFWERRNPKPGSPVNEFKKEYYRRISYANLHFAASGRPGWRTDRGYIYIVYGPPDEIAVSSYGRSPGTHVPYGIEVWNYRHVKGVGDNLSVQFMDTTGKGDFELPPGSLPPQNPVKAQPRKGDDSIAPRVQSSAETSSYGKWLSEGVAYIITEEERAAFRRLDTDEEREKFIEQFWERRNPKPGSPENEFRKEFYRRIAYANEHFASSILGWRTDRGRIYIMYGPPDEIDAHPLGGSYTRPDSQGGGKTLTFPFEQWRYGYIDGIGMNILLEFVDAGMNNEYHLTMDPAEKDLLLRVPGAGMNSPGAGL
jgi:GWxTD domain-containing protein